VDAESGAVLYSSVNVGKATPTPQERISRERAIAIAVEYAGGGSVYEASLEDEHGKLVYEVEFTNHGKVYVDAATGEVVWARLNAPENPYQDDRIQPRPEPRPDLHEHPEPPSYEREDDDEDEDDDEGEEHDDD
jgi:hypothetical protein